MPISTDSETWKDGKDNPSFEELTIAFLSSNPDKAYRLHELADEVIGTEWMAVEERWEAKDTLPEDEYYEQYPSGESYPSAMSEHRHTDAFQNAIRKLVHLGIIEGREVDSDEFGGYPDVDRVIAYSYDAQHPEAIE